LRPWWTVVFCAVLLTYRFWLYLIDGPMPPRWILLAGQLTAVVMVWEQYFSLFGEQAAGTLLTLLVCWKTFELRQKRDYFIAAMLCVLVLMSFMLSDQSLLLTGFLIFDLIFILTFLLSLQEGQWVWLGWKTGLRPALALILKSLPLALVIFLLFPRFSTGFGTAPKTEGKIGIDDHLSPGSVSRLVGSDELVFRATFLNGYMPPPQSLYWRAAVLDVSGGLDWSRSVGENVKHVPQFTMEKGDIEIYLEPGYRKFLFSLENSASLTFPNHILGRVGRRKGGVFELSQPLQTRQRYYLTQTVQSPIDDFDPRPYLQTQGPPSAKLKHFLTRVKGETTSEKVKSLMGFYGSGAFVYSLAPPTAQGLDDFLFHTRTGFCEHFAGSMATILRYLGIPSRVVVGFQGGTQSFLDNYVTVRARDAHAWVEYFDPQLKRWRRVDPTAQVDPQRLTIGSDSYLERRGDWAQWIPGNWNLLYRRTQAVIDEIDASWTGFLMHFDLARQREFLQRLGMEEVLFRALPVFLVLSVVLILAFIYYFEAQKREPLSEEEHLYRQFLRTIRRRWKFEKAISEGPLALMERIERTSPEMGELARPILTALTWHRFAGQAPSPLSYRRIRARIRKLPALAKMPSIKTSRR
jgi:transglutaminase-like putative cysteine protease